MKKTQKPASDRGNNFIRAICKAAATCLIIALWLATLRFIVLLAINGPDIAYFQKCMSTGNVGKTLQYLEWSENGKLLPEKSITVNLSPEQQSEAWEYLDLMTADGHLIFKKQDLRNQVRIQLINPGSPYFYREMYSPDTGLFLSSRNYEEGFAQLLSMAKRLNEAQNSAGQA